MANATRKRQTQKRKQSRRAAARRGSSSGGSLACEMARSVYQPIVEGPAVESALEAEVVASGVLATLTLVNELAGAETTPSAVGQELINCVETRPVPNAVGLLHGLALVAPPALARRARTAVKRLEEKGGWRPIWGSGPAQFKRGLIGTDEYGDREIVVAEFRHAGQQPHALSLLLDPNLGGLLKDVALGEGADEVLKEWHGCEAQVLFREATAEEVGGRLMRGLDAAESYAGEGLVDADVISLGALLLARLRELPVGEEEDLEREMDQDARADLVQRFLASPHASGLANGEFLAGCAVDFKVDYGDGDPLRWSPELVAEFLLDWFPRKVTMVGETAESVPDALRAWVRFAGRQKGLAAHLVAATERAVEDDREEFIRAWDDPSSYGPAKTMVLALTRHGVDLLDQDAVHAWIDSHRDVPWTEWIEPTGAGIPT